MVATLRKSNHSPGLIGFLANYRTLSTQGSPARAATHLRLRGGCWPGIPGQDAALASVLGYSPCFKKGGPFLWSVGVAREQKPRLVARVGSTHISPLHRRVTCPQALQPPGSGVLTLTFPAASRQQPQLALACSLRPDCSCRPTVFRGVCPALHGLLHLPHSPQSRVIYWGHLLALQACPRDLSSPPLKHLTHRVRAKQEELV